MNVAAAKKLTTIVRTQAHPGNENGMISFLIKQINKCDELKSIYQLIDIYSV